MQAVIHNFRRSIHKPSGNQMIVVADGVDSKEKAQGLVGKEVVYHTGKKEIKGEIRSSHGNKGALRVLFETGMPGQAIGQTVEIKK
jgi:large subunit ribosomal protein L35Ae